MLDGPETSNTATIFPRSPAQQYFFAATSFLIYSPNVRTNNLAQALILYLSRTNTHFFYSFVCSCAVCSHVCVCF